MKTTLLSFFIFATTSLFANGRAFDGYFAELVDSLHLSNLPTGTNASPWQIPTEVVYGNTSYSVTPVSADASKLDRIFEIQIGSERQEAVLHVYPALVSNNVARIIGCALGGSSNLPAEVRAKNFAISTNSFGTIFISPSSNCGAKRFLVVLHNDAAFRIMPISKIVRNAPWRFSGPVAWKSRTIRNRDKSEKIPSQFRQSGQARCLLP